MSKVIEVSFPNHFDDRISIDDLTQDIHNYCGLEFEREAYENGLCNEDYEPDSHEYHVEWCEFAINFIHEYKLYEHDNKDELIEELERLSMWWQVQGKLMWEGKDYITEA